MALNYTPVDLNYSPVDMYYSPSTQQPILTKSTTPYNKNIISSGGFVESLPAEQVSSMEVASYEPTKKSSSTSVVRIDSNSQTTNTPTKNILQKESQTLYELGYTPSSLPTHLTEQYTNPKASTFIREESSKKAIQDYTQKVESITSKYDVKKINEKLERLDSEYKQEVSIPKESLIKKYSSVNKISKDPVTGEVTIIDPSVEDTKIINKIQENSERISKELPPKEYFSMVEDVNKYNSFVEVQKQKLEKSEQIKKVVGLRQDELSNDYYNNISKRSERNQLIEEIESGTEQYYALTNQLGTVQILENQQKDFSFKNDTQVGSLVSNTFSPDKSVTKKVVLGSLLPVTGAIAASGDVISLTKYGVDSASKNLITDKDLFFTPEGNLTSVGKAYYQTPLARVGVGVSAVYTEYLNPKINKEIEESQERQLKFQEAYNNQDMNYGSYGVGVKFEQAKIGVLRTAKLPFKVSSFIASDPSGTLKALAFSGAVTASAGVIGGSSAVSGVVKASSYGVGFVKGAQVGYSAVASPETSIILSQDTFKEQYRTAYKEADIKASQRNIFTKILNNTLPAVELTSLGEKDAFVEGIRKYELENDKPDYYNYIEDAEQKTERTLLRYRAVSLVGGTGAIIGVNTKTELLNVPLLNPFFSKGQTVNAKLSSKLFEAGRVGLKLTPLASAEVTSVVTANDLIREQPTNVDELIKTTAYTLPFSTALGGLVVSSSFGKTKAGEIVTTKKGKVVESTLLGANENKFWLGLSYTSDFPSELTGDVSAEVIRRGKSFFTKSEFEVPSIKRNVVNNVFEYGTSKEKITRFRDIFLSSESRGKGLRVPVAVNELQINYDNTLFSQAKSISSESINTPDYTDSFVSTDLGINQNLFTQAQTNVNENVNVNTNVQSNVNLFTNVNTNAQSQTQSNQFVNVNSLFQSNEFVNSNVFDVNANTFLNTNTNLNINTNNPVNVNTVVPNLRTPLIAPFGFGGSENSNRGSKYDLDTAYTPSFDAVLFGITTSKQTTQKVFTGQETRPIISTTTYKQLTKTRSFNLENKKSSLKNDKKVSDNKKNFFGKLRESRIYKAPNTKNLGGRLFK